MWKIDSLSNQTSGGSEKIIKGIVDNFSELSTKLYYYYTKRDPWVQRNKIKENTRNLLWNFKTIKFKKKKKKP